VADRLPPECTLSRGAERGIAESSAMSRSAAVDLEGRRTHIVLHVCDLASRASLQGTSRYSG
jgi:hypothetical protein